MDKSPRPTGDKNRSQIKVTESVEELEALIAQATDDLIW
jgi:hypothetical protein